MPNYTAMPLAQQISMLEQEDKNQNLREAKSQMWKHAVVDLDDAEAELGRETDAPLDDPIDVGVLDADGKAIVLERKRIDRESASFTFTVDRKPVRAGIDPFNKLIDRRPKDNTVPVTISP